MYSNKTTLNSLYYTQTLQKLGFVGLAWSPMKAPAATPSFVGVRCTSETYIFFCLYYDEAVTHGCMYQRSEAMRCGEVRCGAERCDAENNGERSDEATRGKHQRDPKVFSLKPTSHYLSLFEAYRLRLGRELHARPLCLPPTSQRYILSLRRQPHNGIYFLYDAKVFA